MGDNACVAVDGDTGGGMSEIEIAGRKLMEAISINASLVFDAKRIVIDTSKPVEAISDEDIVEAPRTVTDFIDNMTRQVLAANNELREIDAILYRTLGTKIHLG